MPDWAITLITSILGALVPILAGYFTVKTTKDRLESERESKAAEATDMLIDGAKKLVEPLEKRITDLEDENKAIKDFVGRLYDGIKILHNQLKASGLEPDWKPPPRNGWK